MEKGLEDKEGKGEAQGIMRLNYSKVQQDLKPLSKYESPILKPHFCTSAATS